MSKKNLNHSSLNILGGYGYVGSVYHEMYGGIRNEKYDYVPKSNNVLYFISTISNHTFLDNPHRDINTNLTTLVSVLEELKTQDIPTFNFISSGFVYGEHDDIVTENTVCNPKGFYSATKRCAEQLVEFYCKTHGINYRIIRLCNVIGGLDKKTSPKKNAVHFMVNQVLEGKRPTLFLDNKDDKTIREYMDVSDICRAVETILDKGNVNEIFNVSSSDPISQQEILEYAHQKKFNTAFEYDVTPPSDFEKSIYIPSIRMSNDKINQLGFVAEKGVRDIIDSLVENYND
tara:strand:+ start:1114 stop:1977 length:864 start_codon:yes stop_codon:yes gene_type:complete